MEKQSELQSEIREARPTGSQRLLEALKATAIARVVPLWGIVDWGIVEHGAGGLRCECRRGRGCKSPGKHPRVGGWQEAATRDHALIREWFEQAPSMNFGAVLEGIFVLDADVKVRKDGSVANGPATLALLEEHYGERLAWTTTVETGRGQQSCHRYYVVPPNTRIRSGTDVLPGVDVKANRALAVLPGSVHQSGRLYLWAEEASPQEASPVPPPGWLMALLVDWQEESLWGGKGDAFAALLKRDFGFNVDAVKIDPHASLGWRLLKLLSSRKRNHQRILATWLRQRGPDSRYPLADQSSSGYEMALADFAGANGWPPQAIVDLLVHWRRKHGLGTDALHRHRVRATLLTAYRFAHEAGKLKGRRGRKSSLPGIVEAMLDENPDAGRNLAELARTFGASPATVRKIVQRLRQRSVTNSG
jgi:hypothetical protein